MFARTAQLIVAVAAASLFAGGCNKNMADSDRSAGKSLLPAASQPSGATGKLPAGHPPMGKMPKGHPPLGKMPSGHPKMPRKNALTWKTPASFKLEAPTNRYRRAQYRLAGAGKAEGALLVVSHFPGMGGSTADNLKRWYRQLQPPAGAPTPETKTRKVGKLEVVTTFAVGAYMQPKDPTRMRGPKVKRDNWAILGAIVNTPDGPWFFKAVGPQKTIEHHRAAFDKMLSSVALPKPTPEVPKVKAAAKPADRAKAAAKQASKQASKQAGKKPGKKSGKTRAKN